MASTGFVVTGLPALEYSAAARPAAAPKTRHSDREFEPSPFAPLRPTFAHSPAAHRPAIGVAPETSAAMPPLMYCCPVRTRMGSLTLTMPANSRLTSRLNG